MIAKGQSLYTIDSAKLKIPIIVSEYNYYAPEFEMTIYTALVYYLSPIETKVLQVKAKDRDIIDYNAKIIYSIFNRESDSPFDINSETGEISVVNKIHNFKVSFQWKSFLFDVFANNIGSPKRSNSTFINIQITKIQGKESLIINYSNYFNALNLN